MMLSHTTFDGESFCEDFIKIRQQIKKLGLENHATRLEICRRMS
jgi:hypothetical protein